MAEEAERIEGWARTWDHTYRRLAQQWARVNSCLVIGAAVLAAGSATTGLAKLVGPLAAGLLALAAAVVSGIAGSLRASAKSTGYNTAAAAANSGLADDARVFRMTVVEALPLAEVRTKFDALCARRDRAVNGAPVSRAPWSLSGTQLAAWPPGLRGQISDGGHAQAGLQTRSQHG